MSLLLPLLPRPMSRGRLDGLRYHLLSLGCPKNTVNSACMEGWAAGRSFRDAPEIDGTVVVRSPEPPALDRFVRVRVEAADAYTLRATATGSPW